MSTYNSRRSFISKAAIAAAMSPFATFGQGYEQAVERTLRDPLVKVSVAVLTFERAAHRQLSTLGDNVDVFSREPSERHHDAVGILSGLLDVVRGVSAFVTRERMRKQGREPVETDGGMVERR